MLDDPLRIEPLLRLGSFAGVLLIMMVLEALLPRRRLEFDRLIRWPANFGVTMLNTVMIRVIFPTAAVGFALAREGGGLFGLMGLSPGVALVLGIVLLDLAIYTQHVVFHKVPVLWRVHAMHHTDNDFDVTTALRFHPVEILLSMLIKFAVIAALGIPAAAVLLFEVFLASGALFNHSNFALPLSLDRVLRLFIVTPDMHRVHHSVVRAETDSNFGFNLSLWDRVFGTYKAQPDAGHEGMTIGLPEPRGMDAQRIDRMLAYPFRRPPSSAAQ